MQAALLSTAYLPPIQYMSKFLSRDVSIECHENYPKQTYRNRCNILSANGPIALTIPTIKQHGQKTRITEVRIDYDLPWQKIHFKSIESAYKNSPFYDYYIDELAFYYTKQFEFLFDYNLEIIKTLLDISEIPFTAQYTSHYEKNIVGEDFRYSITPKESQQSKDSSFVATEYYQVFEDKYRFVPNLSYIDLLFNEGPNAKEILACCIKKGED